MKPNPKSWAVFHVNERTGEVIPYFRFDHPQTKYEAIRNALKIRMEMTEELGPMQGTDWTVRAREIKG